MLRTGRYEVGVPEEAGLLVAAWFMQTGNTDEARTLLDELAPHPPPARLPGPVRSLASGRHPCVRGASRSRTRHNPRILAQKEAIEVWAPLYDQMVALLLETVEGPLPSAERDASGKVLVHGGWPGRRFPYGWAARAHALLEQYERLRAQHRRCGKPERKKDSFAQVRHYLRRCMAEPRSLDG